MKVLIYDKHPLLGNQLIGRGSIDLSLRIQEQLQQLQQSAVAATTLSISIHSAKNSNNHLKIFDNDMNGTHSSNGARSRTISASSTEIEDSDEVFGSIQVKVTVQSL